VSVPGVLLDTSAWIGFFSPIGHDVLKAEVRKALNEERVFTCAVVQTELLVGARDRAAFKKLDELLHALPQASMDDGLWTRAARLGFALRKKGRSISLSDLLIAEACRSRALQLWHLDEHYEAIREQAEFSTRSFLGALSLATRRFSLPSR
jgi:predicted nucleic acid-binding protein